MSPLALIYLVNYDERFEAIFSANLLNLPSYSIFLYLRLRNLLDYDYDIYQYHVSTVENLEIEIEITVLGKKIRKLDSKRIVKIRTINGIIGEKEIKYIW